MILQSAFNVLLFVSLVKGVPNPYLGNIGGWLSYPSNSENELGERTNEEIPSEKLRTVVDEFSANIEPEKVEKFVKSDKPLPIEYYLDKMKHKKSKIESGEIDYEKEENQQLRRVVNADSNNEGIKVKNPDKPIPIDDFLDDINDKADMIDDSEKEEMVPVLKQLRTAIYDDSIRKVNVLIKGFWHAVDLGLAGSSQRKRAAEKSDGLLEAFINVLRKFNEWFWGLFGYEPENKENHDEDKDKDKTESDKDKDKEKDKDNDKNEKDRKKSLGLDSDDEDGDGKPKKMRENGSHDSSGKEGKSEVVLKPLKSEEEDGEHKSSDEKLAKHPHTIDGESAESAMKRLSDLSSVFAERLKTRQEVDEVLRQAREKKEDKNKYYIESENAKKERDNEKDDREWTEDKALDRLEEMNKEFDKADKATMAKDILSLSMQPLFYVETYDEILSMIDRLMASGADETKLAMADDYAFNHKLFSLKDSIMQTPKKIYRTGRQTLHAEISKKEKGKHGNTEIWTDDQANDKIDKMNENFAKTTDKTQMVKDLTSMALQPFLKIETYNKMHAMMMKLKTEGKIPEADLRIADDSIRRQARFTHVDNILEKSDMEEHERLKQHSDEAQEKREKLGDTRKFTEEQALEKIDDMDQNFDKKDKPEMVKDITNLSLQPLYHVETYDKMSNLISKMKAGGIAETELKPAIDSIKEERDFSADYDITKKPEGSLAQKLKNLKHEYLVPEPLTKEKKQKLFQELHVLRDGDIQFTPHEAKDAYLLLKSLMKGNPTADGLDPKELGYLHQLIDNSKKKNVSTGKSTAVSSGSNFDLTGWQLGKVADGKVVTSGKVVSI